MSAAFGRDIYAVSAPIIVEALQRLLASDKAEIAGVRSLGEIFDARAFLEFLSQKGDLRVTFQTGSSPLFTRSPESARLAAGLS